jgi:hypothetical protein
MAGMALAALLSVAAPAQGSVAQTASLPAGTSHVITTSAPRVSAAGGVVSSIPDIYIWVFTGHIYPLTNAGFIACVKEGTSWIQDGYYSFQCRKNNPLSGYYNLWVAYFDK